MTGTPIASTRPTAATLAALAQAVLIATGNPPAQAADRAHLLETIDTRPPRTSITAGPAPTTTLHRAVFRFKADEPASFECKLDGGKWHGCKSKRIFNVAKGRHTFRVRAGDEAGNVDPTPAKYSWRVS